MQSRGVKQRVVYKAILNPKCFDNAVFWKGIADYKNGCLEHYVIHAEKTVKSDRHIYGSFWINSAFSSSAVIYYPCLEDMMYMLCGTRLGYGKQDDETAIQGILLRSCRTGHIVETGNMINRTFGAYGGTSSQVIPSEREWWKRTPPVNTYPGFIGHKDFVLPLVAQRPITAAFWLSVLMMTAGIAAIICAFAFMQAGSLAVGGTVLATVGVAALLKGVSIFLPEREEMIEHNELIAQETARWRPIP